MSVCPHCGQMMPKRVSQNAEALLQLLRTERDRNVYRSQNDGRWYVTRGGYGPWSNDTVMGLVSNRLLSSVYSNCPSEAYHFGPTFDVEATMAQRKKYGKGTPIIFVTNSEPVGYENCQ